MWDELEKSIDIHIATCKIDRLVPCNDQEGWDGCEVGGRLKRGNMRINSVDS